MRQQLEYRMNITIELQYLTTVCNTTCGDGSENDLPENGLGGFPLTGPFGSANVNFPSLGESPVSFLLPVISSSELKFNTMFSLFSEEESPFPT